MNGDVDLGGMVKWAVSARITKMSGEPSPYGAVWSRTAWGWDDRDGVRCRPRPAPSSVPRRPFMTTQRPRGVHLVGSVPLADEAEVFRTVGSILGEHARRIPDGETGVRTNWIGWQ